MSGHSLPTTYPVARKTYWCDLCSMAIEKGEKHAYYSEFYDGEFYSSRYHDWCDDLASKLTKDWDSMDFESCSVSVAFDEWIHEKYCEWGIDEEMHILGLLESLEKWRERGDGLRVQVTCKAILAQLEHYTGHLIDKAALVERLEGERE